MNIDWISIILLVIAWLGGYLIGSDSKKYK